MIVGAHSFLFHENRRAFPHADGNGPRDSTCETGIDAANLKSEGQGSVGEGTHDSRGVDRHGGKHLKFMNKVSIKINTRLL